MKVRNQDIHIKIIETSDIHGSFFPYNFVTDRPSDGSLARVCALLEKRREKLGNRLIYIDNGDILQGQPTSYYYDFIETQSEHVAASMLNYMKCDVGVVGNHDIETGHAVYDRWIKECNFPVLGANIISLETGQPYLRPYTVLERGGVKIAVLGMITSAIPMWLPEPLWSGLRFDDMEVTAKKWVPIIQEREKPDVLIGVFHAGRESIRQVDIYNEDATLDIARNVPGFDVILIGHDHRRFCDKVKNLEGKDVWIVNPANNGIVVGEVDLKLTLRQGKVLYKKIAAKLTRTSNFGVSREFVARFYPQYEAVRRFVSRKIGTFKKTMLIESAFFGPSAFIDFIHTMQLELTGADVSFCAPFSFNARIKAGDVYMRDMFSLYRYENMLYTIEMTGVEIKNYLEMSYALWTNQMKSPQDSVLLLESNGADGRFRGFKNFIFNFDSAAGIRYTVDVTKAQGHKIQIQSLANGCPFELGRTYRVAINSYRGNGGGELLTVGAGISNDRLSDRIVAVTTKDLRYYLMEYIQRKKEVDPQPFDQWKLIPEEWVRPAVERDRKWLFGRTRKSAD